jgi:hypothetical protein
MKRLSFVPLALAAVLAGGATRVVEDQCGPFTDVTPAFCPYVLELYYLGITVGTSATTFSPDDPLTRGQGAVFIAKGLNQSLARSSRRAALGQWWTTTPQWDKGLGVTTVGDGPAQCVSDGADVWVTNNAFGTENGSVSRVRASDGRLLETWTGATSASGIVVAAGRVFVTGLAAGALYMIDPSQPAGSVTTVASIPGFPTGIAFDGANLWTANSAGSVSIVPLSFAGRTDLAGYSAPVGLVFDGAHMWVSDHGANTLVGLNSDGSIFQTVPVGLGPEFPVFDGANVWVPSSDDDTVTVVHASTGLVIATLSGNGLNQPVQAGFDGARILVTNPLGPVSLWRAADLTPLGTIPTGNAPGGVCSEGLNFWVTLSGTNQLGRF